MLVVYIISFTDNKGHLGVVKFPAVSPLMAQAWAELCFEANQWLIVTLRADENVIWSASNAN